jgi:hypothetical protein
MWAEPSKQVGGKSMADSGLLPVLRMKAGGRAERRGCNIRLVAAISTKSRRENVNPTTVRYGYFRQSVAGIRADWCGFVASIGRYPCASVFHPWLNFRRLTRPTPAMWACY